MIVTFLRHTESEFNRDPTCPTRDCALTETGRQQAATLTGHYPLVLVSPLQRARQTLQYSRITYDRVEVSDLVREQRVDACDFLVEEELRVESDEELMHRGNQLLQRLRHSPYESVLVISHCEFISSLTGESPLNGHSVHLIVPDLAPISPASTASTPLNSSLEQPSPCCIAALS
jgi:broad specificity phosphatase PhoE